MTAVNVSNLGLKGIAISPWGGGRSMGCAPALASTGGWLATDLLGRHTYGHWFVPLWNTFTLAILRG